MNEPWYVEKYDIRTIKSPIYLWHSSIHHRGDIPEYEDITVSTNTFDLDELKEMYTYGWFMQTFHSLGITEYISKFYNQVYDLNYIDFYTSLKDYCENFTSLFQQEYKTLRDYIDIGYDGGGWNHYDESLAEILWPIEEATWLRCVKNSKVLQNELLKFVEFLERQRGFQTDSNITWDLVKFQTYFLESDREKWCMKAIWIGRSQGNYKCHPEFLYENLNELFKDLRETTQEEKPHSGV